MFIQLSSYFLVRGFVWRLPRRRGFIPRKSPPFCASPRNRRNFQIRAGLSAENPELTLNQVNAGKEITHFVGSRFQGIGAVDGVVLNA